LSPSLYQTGSVTDQAARHYKLSIGVHGRNPMARCESCDLLSPKRITLDKQRPGSCLDRTFEGRVDFAIGARFHYLNLQPNDRSSGASRSLVVSSNIGLFGFPRKPIAAVPGTSSCNSASALAPSSPWYALKPVRLPPGRLRLVTSPSCTGSAAAMDTIGMLVVAAFAARVGITPAATITVT